MLDTEIEREIVLSIVIPTYNRLALLDHQLVSIQRAVARLENPALVELVISDNASAYSLAELEVIARRTGLRYRLHRNVCNIGADANFFTAIALASGRWTWLMGDDDEIAPHALEVLLSVLMQRQPDYLFVNFDRYNFTLENMISGPEFRGGKAGSVVEFEDPNDFVRKLGLAFTFMTSNVYLTSMVRNCAANYTGFIGCSVIQYLLTLAIVADTKKFAALTDVLVHVRGGQVNQYDEVEAFHFGLSRVLDVAVQSLGYRRDCLPSSKYSLLTGLKMFAIYRATNDFHFSPRKFIASTIYSQGLSFRVWFVWVPLVFLPRSFYKSLYAFMRRLKPRAKTADDPGRKLADEG